MSTEDVPAIGPCVGILGRKIERILRDGDGIAVVRRVGPVAAERVVERELSRTPHDVAEAGEQSVIAALRRRLAHGDAAVPLIRPRQVGAPQPDDIGRLGIVDVNRPNQVVAP